MKCQINNSGYRREQTVKLMSKNRCKKNKKRPKKLLCTKRGEYNEFDELPGETNVETQFLIQPEQNDHYKFRNSKRNDMRSERSWKTRNARIERQTNRASTHCVSLSEQNISLTTEDSRTKKGDDNISCNLVKSNKNLSVSIEEQGNVIWTNNCRNELQTHCNIWQDNQNDTSYNNYNEVNHKGNKKLEKVIAQLKEGPSLEHSILSKKVRFYIAKEKVLVAIERGCMLKFIGKLKIQTIHGAIDICGLTLCKTSIPIEVYSPRGHNFVGIEVVYQQSESTVASICKLLKTEGIDHTVISSLERDINENQWEGSLVLMENLENKLTRFLSSSCPFKLFPTVEDPQKNYSLSNQKKAEVVLQASFHLHEENGLRWENDIAIKLTNRLQSGYRTCGLVVGGKGVGKSTTVRYLVNKLLPERRAVVLLDLDPGQAECTPAGCISLNVLEEALIGPNFSHLRTPFYQLYVGEVNVVRCVSRYLEAVEKLLYQLNKCPELSRLPILVNTMGFCKGLGWDIIVRIIRLVRPSDVVQIISTRSKRNFDSLLYADVIGRKNHSWIDGKLEDEEPHQEPLRYELHMVESRAELREGSVIGESWEMEPHQQRDVAMLAYLAQILQTPQEKSLKFYEKHSLKSISINGTPPYTVPFSSVSISLTRLVVPPSHILAAMNGNIVALCGVDVDKELPGRSDSGYPNALIRAPLATCYGFGIVRGIDMGREEIYLNSPLSAHLLQFVNCLVGSSTIPMAMIPFEHCIRTPYIAGGRDELPTSREPRRGLFRISQKSRSSLRFAENTKKDR
ncbi:polynucleotide 5'-hydroxyl-kinase NOL9 isoform X2 [Cephus cinctus]|uniref:Polynucleotide 5'-hydroxyl-kinase NOL9 n=1 Tax=Cephus cinctus TaxID=211228 RepID=A0AAJ7W0Y8_CEPCN|nr:polynucleotide 5'-hydroxyl-kinase NOL9 isoform X2 [Cephus cinctus]